MALPKSQFRATWFAAALLGAALSAPGRADFPPTVIDVRTFGAVAGSGRDAGPAIRQAIGAALRAEAHGPVILRFPTGRYDLFEASMPREITYISATVPASDHPSKVLTIGLKFEGHRGLTVDGEGSTFMFHGRLTPFVVKDCQDITFLNFQTDFERPDISEMRVIAVGGNWLEAQIQPDSKYVIRDGRLHWIGEDGAPIGWKEDGNLVEARFGQAFDPALDMTWRMPNAYKVDPELPPIIIHSGAKIGVRWPPTVGYAEEIRPGVVRFTYRHMPAIRVGWVLQTCDGMRDEVGAFTSGSRNVCWEDVQIHSTCNLGFITQLSENVTFRRVNLGPREGSNRTAAIAQDGMQFANCRGTVDISGCRFEGIFDDFINIYGNQLRFVRKLAARKAEIDFPCDEQFGFLTLFPGDELQFLEPRNLRVIHQNRVIAARLVSPMQMEVELAADLPDGMEGSLVENRLWMPSVHIHDCTFARGPARGILISTWHPSVIDHNVFFRTPGPGILVNNGDKHWYLQGPVEDLDIHDNVFYQCNGGLRILPENEDLDWTHPVHRNVRFRHNLYVYANPSVMELTGIPQVPWMVRAKSTAGLDVSDNRIVTSDPDPEVVELSACSAVTIHGNAMLSPTGRASVVLSVTPEDQIRLDEPLGWKVLSSSRIR